MTRPGIELRFPRSLANSLTIMPMSGVLTNPIYFIYMNKQDLALDSLQRLICQKNKQNQTNPGISGFRISCKLYRMSKIEILVGVFITKCHRSPEYEDELY